jgi:hypothetical protein
MSPRVSFRLAMHALGGLCAVAVLAGAAQAAELAMFRRAGCPWCAVWDREIGPIYPKTEFSRRAPLRMVDLDRGGDDSIRIRLPIRYTPTFVLVDDGREIGRIEGYPGEAFFWGLLERLFERLPPGASDGHSAFGVYQASPTEPIR